MVFHFPVDEDVPKVINRVWIMKGSFLNIKRWQVYFDHEQQRMVLKHLLLLFPVFSIDLWTKNIMVAFANNFGHFIPINKKMSNNVDKRVAKIMLELGISKGLLAEVELIGVSG